MPAAESWLAEAEARRDEPLHPDLVPYLMETDFIGPVLKHPLVYDVPHIPPLAYRCNDVYQAKLEYLRRYEAEGDWQQYIWAHERPHRAEALWKIRRKVTNRQYWELLGEVWTDSENIFQWDAPRMLTVQRPGRKYMMDEEERAALRELDPKLRIWRGYPAPRGRKLGWSWTLLPAKGVWFANRLARGDEQPTLAVATVDKDNVIAHFLGRGEQEIVVDPRYLREVGTSLVTPRNT